MNSKRFRLILLAVFGLCVLGFVGTAYKGMALLEKKSNDMVELKLKNKKAESQLANLEAAKKDIDKYSFFRSVAQSVIPNDKDQAQAVLEINKFAQESKIALQSITFPSSNLGGKPGAASAAVSTPATTSNNQKALSQAVPVSGTQGLYSLKLTVSVLTGKNVPTGYEPTYPKMIDFLRRIENNRRTAQITQVTVQMDLVNGQFSFILDLNIFIKP